MSLIDDIKINSLSDAQEILKAARTEDIFEKAHKDGDLHPNGKWVWVSSAAGGKGDWRTLNGRTHKKHQAANAAGGSSNSSQSSSTTTTSSAKQTNIKSKDEKFIETFKEASDDVLQKIISGKIQATDREKKLAKKIFDDRKKNESSKSKKSVVGGASLSINPTFQKYFSISNSKFTDPKKMSVSKTPQGNWSLSHDGKRISTVAPLTDADKKNWNQLE